MDDVSKTSADLGTGASGNLPVAGFDAARYRAHVAHLDISEAAKDEMLQAVWRIMRSFVDRAFGDDSVQLARNAGDNPDAAREAREGGTLDSAGDEELNNDSALAESFRKSAKSD